MHMRLTVNTVKYAGYGKQVKRLVKRDMFEKLLLFGVCVICQQRSTPVWKCSGL